MVEVWLGAAGLALVALAVVVAGARRRPRRVPGDEADVLLADRRGEIAAEARLHNMAGDEVAALEQELALEFIETDEDRADTQLLAARPPLLPLVGGAAAAVVLAIGLYALWGEPDAPTLENATALMSDAGASPEALADLERALAARVARRPDDGDGWFYLGHLRMRSEDYAGAVEAFAALHGLTGGNEQVDLTWAQAGFLAAGGVLDDATHEIVERVLGRRPEHPNMLELLAMDAIRRSSFANAAGFLDRALRQPLAVSRRVLLEETLALVRSRLDAASPDVSNGVTVNVSTDAALNATTPIFVIVRRPDVPGPPVAVRRLVARDLPAQVTLTDADAMLPGTRLSDLAALEVVARASLSGSPTRTSGDIESAVVTTQLGQETPALHIVHLVP